MVPMPTTVLLRGRLILHGVIANQDVRQRGGAAEQGQHQRQEVQLGRKAIAAQSLERGTAPRQQHLAAGRRLGIINRGLAPVGLEELGFVIRPQNDFAPLQRAKELDGIERARGLRIVRQTAEVSDRIKLGGAERRAGGRLGERLAFVVQAGSLAFSPGGDWPAVRRARADVWTI